MEQKRKYKQMRNWFLGTVIAGSLILCFLTKPINHKKQVQEPNLETRAVQSVQVGESINVDEDAEDVNDRTDANNPILNINKYDFPKKELEIINYTANRVGVEPALLMAIRKAENGKEGLEFGVIPTKIYENDKGITERGKLRLYINDFEKQASWCAWTIKKNLKRYGEYDNNFISFLHKQYAPIGVENDPSGLNKNWEKNVRFFYEKYKN